MKGVFVIGTDTGVGKTCVCAGLMRVLYGSRKIAYWKPVQTGTIVGNDPKEVKELTALPNECFIEPVYRFPEPLAPHMAAKKWGKTIEIDELTAAYHKQEKAGTFLLIEGAGGILTPYSDTTLQIDFMKKTGLPVLVIAQDRVGQVNQTLLTLKALRETDLKLLGVVLTRMRGTFGNAETIAHFGKVEVLAQISDTPNKSSLIAEVGGNDRLRTLFNVPKLP
jgi:dethiobiotin synthetase